MNTPIEPVAARMRRMCALKGRRPVYKLAHYAVRSGLRAVEITWRVPPIGELERPQQTVAAGISDVIAQPLLAAHTIIGSPNGVAMSLPSAIMIAAPPAFSANAIMGVAAAPVY